MWSDPLALYLFFGLFAAAFLFIQMGRAVVRELKGINRALTMIAGQASVGNAMNRIVDEVQDTRIKLTSILALLPRSIDGVASKIEDKTTAQRRKQSS